MKMTAKIALFCLIFSAAFTASAQDKATNSMAQTHTMKGYLVDKMCAVGMAKKAPDEAMAKAEKHTKSCALEESCAESGFGLICDGKWYKFDGAGDKKALAWLNKTDKKNDLMVEVTGTHDGDIFKVVSLKEVKSVSGKKKADSKQDEMKMDGMKKG